MSSNCELKRSTNGLNRNLEEANSGHPWQVEVPAREGRFHYRAAGRAYEDVARLRFATRQFPEDLWLAAENYFLGHSYTHTIRILEEYLHHEARRHNALALLRLGQSHLALGHPAQAIDLLNSCIEMHPRDAVVYQAHLECARSHRDHGEPDLAEKIAADQSVWRYAWVQPHRNGKTRSLPWGTCSFTRDNTRKPLGDWKKRSGAIPRHPMQCWPAISSRVLFTCATVSPRKKMETAKTEDDRQKNRKLYTHLLNQALHNYQAVQRAITLDGHRDMTPLNRNLLRNCYMMQGSVLFQLRRYEEARKAYANVTTLYQDEPFVLESFVQIANCWQRLNEPVKARGTIEQAKLVLGRMPADTDFKLATNLNRQGWKLLLEQMGKW